MSSLISPAPIRIGTSGWHYKHWLGKFYPTGTPASGMLDFYARHFDTVELNNSFYHLPKQAALDRWRESTSPGFCFSVKASRFLTHMKKLKDVEAGLAKFLEAAEILDQKLGPILFQLPPGWEVDVDRLRSFLTLLPHRHRYAFEFRNVSWETAQVYDLLSQFGIGYCAFDLAGYQSPVQITADFAYVRLHGPGGKYQGSYGQDALEGWAGRIAAWRRELSAVFVYFDNDDSAYAAENARVLKTLVS